MYSYSYNPHTHVKIWLSNNPNIFMNYENQVRLISMRETNPEDDIHLIYDSSLLCKNAINELKKYCREHNILPVDANKVGDELKSAKEHELYKHYKGEITHLTEGGNLAVASDILRWLSPVYELGTYTDFDFPVNTSKLKKIIEVNAPILLNIGSLQMGGSEFILSNNDYVAIVDSVAAASDIERVQQGILSKLTSYDTDFIEQLEGHLAKGVFNRFIFNLMKNRSESFYISQSAQFQVYHSRSLRHYIQTVMSNQDEFLKIKRQDEETSADTLTRLRNELKKQLNFIRYLFFYKDYAEIKAVLAGNDEDLIQYMMKKERDLYLKSIVICTTGPLEISRSLFGGYVVSTKEFAQNIQGYSFNNYGLQKAFKSSNSLPLHENIIGMMRFLGADEGQCNDSSWLESGGALQAKRAQGLKEKQRDFAQQLPKLFQQQKTRVEKHIKTLSHGHFFKERRAAKRAALKDILTECFTENQFDTKKFQKLLLGIHLYKRNVFSGLFSNRTLKLFQEISALSKQSVLLGLTQNRKVNLSQEQGESVSFQL